MILLRPILDDTPLPSTFQVKVAQTLVRRCTPVGWVERTLDGSLEMVRYLLLDTS
jgi:hypothetical protein